jgi:molybdopterin synthase catalytic subunit
MNRILIQLADFHVGNEYERLREAASSDGAVVTFTGLVRELSPHGNLESMSLEHYPDMTEKALVEICVQARERWQLGQVTIIHRVGTLTPDEQIVFLGVSSSHRKSAYEASMFIMDILKTEAPFWKKETTDDGDYWVEAKQSDKEAALRW